MRRLWTWIVVILVAGFLLRLPSVALWRPTPSTPASQGLFVVAGFTPLASSVLLSLGSVMAALALAAGWDVIRLPTGGRATRAALVGGGLLLAGLVLLVVQGFLLGATLAGSVVAVAAVLQGAGAALIGVWLVGRLAPPEAAAAQLGEDRRSDQSHPR